MMTTRTDLEGVMWVITILTPFDFSVLGFASRSFRFPFVILAACSMAAGLLFPSPKKCSHQGFLFLFRGFRDHFVPDLFPPLVRVITQSCRCSNDLNGSPAPNPFFMLFRRAGFFLPVGFRPLLYLSYLFCGLVSGNRLLFPYLSGGWMDSMC